MSGFLYIARVCFGVIFAFPLFLITAVMTLAAVLLLVAVAIPYLLIRMLPLRNLMEPLAIGGDSSPESVSETASRILQAIEWCFSTFLAFVRFELSIIASLIRKSKVE